MMNDERGTMNETRALTFLPFIVHHSSFIVHRSSLIIHHSSFIVLSSVPRSSF